MRALVPAILAALPLALAGAAEPVRFNRDVRAILSDNCFQCHGPDSAKRVTAFRLDSESGIGADLGGHRAVVPGKPLESELFLRVSSSDPAFRMPAAASGKDPLRPEQVETLRRWIEEGAVWEPHWSFIPPREPSLPSPRGSSWTRNPVDLFVLSRLEREGLEPSPEASRETLIRRASIDITGIPPTVDEVDAFLADAFPDAYERLVDRLLASPRHGERMVLEWLDAARYADTNGYQGDNTRTSWHWRDWAIDAYNDNLPFDRFTVEQLAGDLLPGRTQAQMIATGFHRNHMLNGEGGRIAEESRVDYVMDRVETTATVWLGLTLGCARCHDHKYDPFTQKDYYSLFAYFNNMPESGGVDAGGNALPILAVRTPEIEEKIASLEREIAAAEERLAAPDPEVDAAQSEWETSLAAIDVALSPWRAAGPFEAGDLDRAFAKAFEPEPEAPRAAGGGAGLEWTPRPEWADDTVIPLTGSGCATYAERTVRVSRAVPATISLGSDDGIKVWVNGRQVFTKKIVRAAEPDQDRITVDLEAGENTILLKVVNGAGGYGFYFKLLDAGAPPEILAIARTPEAGRAVKAREEIRAFYRARVAPGLRAVSGGLDAARTRKAEIEASLPKTMVMEEMAKPRDSFVLIRGSYEKRGEKVAPRVPAALPPLPDGSPPNRLGLARWLVDPSNPLTARVAVNRYWEMLFGTGLVKTTEDFGAQGELPSHPELLDWLAVRFSRDWDTRAILRLMLTSATYRQSSAAKPSSYAQDPSNRLLSRGPRHRLSSFALRDQALHVAGLLLEKIGGPPVRPYQPPGIWEDLTFGQIRYQQDAGEALRRRSLYIFWRRSIGPTMLFDTSARQVCTVRQARTNTPLHALVLLNETAYVEASRAFAERMLRRSASDEERIEWAFRTVTARRPDAEEKAVLARAIERLRSQYRDDPGSAEALLGVGESPRDASLDPIETAAHAGLASILLNLDEAVTKE